VLVIIKHYFSSRKKRVLPRLLDCKPIRRGNEPGGMESYFRKTWQEKIEDGPRAT